MHKMRKQILVTVLGFIVLPLVFVLIQGLFARIIVPTAEYYSLFSEGKGVQSMLLYVIGVVGSSLSAFVVVFPSTLFLPYAQKYFGAMAGTIATLSLILVTRVFEASVLVEYAFLIVFCELAAISALKARRSSGKQAYPGFGVTPSALRSVALAGSERRRRGIG